MLKIRNRILAEKRKYLDKILKGADHSMILSVDDKDNFSNTAKFQDIF